LRYSIIPALEGKLPKDGESSTKSSEEGTLIHESVTADDIAAVVSRMTGIPVSKLTSGHVERLINMEDILRQSVRGQDEALKAVSNAIRMQRAGLNGENRPLASFFFLGPTGVGKTELCKKLANYLFSTESAVVRFDMSEFQEKHTISRLIGRYVSINSFSVSTVKRQTFIKIMCSPAGYVGYDDAGQLTEAVRRKPYAVLLFDEFEKAVSTIGQSPPFSMLTCFQHRDISALLLQVFQPIS
jgi:ATP-dependent Clp protease ATP-binding subunit ClpB